MQAKANRAGKKKKHGGAAAAAAAAAASIRRHARGTDGLQLLKSSPSEGLLRSRVEGQQ